MANESEREATALKSALSKAVERLLKFQNDEGAFQMNCRTGPQIAAAGHLVMSRLGYSKPGDGDKLFRQMITQYQLPDGSFGENPGDAEGSLMATAAVWGSLTATGVPANSAGLREAKAWIDKHGGLESLGNLAMGADPWAIGPLLAFAGLIKPECLRERYLPLVQCLLPGMNELLASKINPGLLMAEEWIAGLVGSLQRAETSHPDDPFAGWIQRRERDRVRALSEEMQNPNGSWNDLVGFNALAMAALYQMGVPSDAPVLAKAARWIEGARIETDDTLDYLSNRSDVWDTALCVDGLMHAQELGVDVKQGAVTSAVAWLIGPAHQTEQAERYNMGSDAVRTGGWAFEKGNVNTPDTDDTALAMVAIQRYRRRRAELDDAAPEPVSGSEAAVNGGATWLLGMQHSDGGWGAFIADQPARPKQLLFQHPVMSTEGVDWMDPEQVATFVSTQLAQAADVSTAALSARVLSGLVATGSGLHETAIVRATEFIRSQQQPSGAWFGRWTVNYVGGTGFVLRGLGDLGCRLDGSGGPLTAPNQEAIVTAVAWLRSTQNDDGGWGETPASYGDPEMAAKGPSMPGLTGVALGGLLAVGCRGDCVDRAARYLLDSQAPDGSWPGNNWLQAFCPPNNFYVMPSADTAYPLSALSEYAAIKTGVDVQKSAQHRALVQSRLVSANVFRNAISIRDSAGGWSAEALRAQRETGDPSADMLIMKIFHRHERVILNDWFRHLVSNETPIADGPIPEVSDWLEETGDLPPWADARKIDLAQHFFIENVWQITFCLFFSSLPFAYAAGNGAKVLVRTGGMTRKFRARIMETAQFLFDVVPPGALTPEGSGLRTIQKVRLLHASIRCLLLQDPTWDMKRGVPINQEDLAGTMLSFSVVILGGLRKMGTPMSDAQADAWLHYWNIVGHLMGVREELLPRSETDGVEEGYAIADDQWHRSDHGTQLATELVAFLGEHIPLPGSEALATSAIRELAGDRCADMLALPRNQLADRALKTSLAVSKGLLSLGVPHAKANPLEYLSEFVFRSVIAIEREGKGAPFRIPGALKHDWTRAA